MTDEAASEAIQLSDLADSDRAKELFHELLSGSERRMAIIRAFGENPQGALARLQDGDDPLGLTPKGSADVLDEIVGAIPDAQASKLLDDQLTVGRLRELLRGRGDLPSSAALTANRRVLMAAIAEEVAEAAAKHEAAGALLVRAWAMKICDRDDYTECLRSDLDGRLFVHHLLAAIWYSVEQDFDRAEVQEDDSDEEFGRTLPSADDLLSALGIAPFEELGIDPSDGSRMLFELVESGDIAKIDFAELSEARLEVTRRREELERAPTMIDDAQDEAAEAAEDLDF